MNEKFVKEGNLKKEEDATARQETLLLHALEPLYFGSKHPDSKFPDHSSEETIAPVLHTVSISVYVFLSVYLCVSDVYVYVRLCILNVSNSVPELKSWARLGAQ